MGAKSGSFTVANSDGLQSGRWTLKAHAGKSSACLWVAPIGGEFKIILFTETDGRTALGPEIP